MAAKRKTKPAQKKRPAKPAARKVAKKKPAPARRAAPKQAPAKPPKRRGTPRKPPMVGTVTNPELGDEAHDEVFETFKAFDRDGSGSIDRAELARLLEALGQPIDDEELEIALEVIDANGSGRVSWSEFKAWWTDR